MIAPQFSNATTYPQAEAEAEWQTVLRTYANILYTKGSDGEVLMKQ